MKRFNGTNIKGLNASRISLGQKKLDIAFGIWELLPTTIFCVVFNSSFISRSVFLSAAMPVGRTIAICSTPFSTYTKRASSFLFCVSANKRSRLSGFVHIKYYPQMVHQRSSKVIRA